MESRSFSCKFPITNSCTDKLIYTSASEIDGVIFWLTTLSGFNFLFRLRISRIFSNSTSLFLPLLILSFNKNFLCSEKHSWRVFRRVFRYSRKSSVIRRSLWIIYLWIKFRILSILPIHADFKPSPSDAGLCALAIIGKFQDRFEHKLHRIIYGRESSASKSFNSYFNVL